MQRVCQVAAIAIAVACAGVPASARAAEQTDAAAVENARWLFAEGNAHFHAGRFAAALSAFEKSHSLVDSPNTMLMIARSLRELGRTIEAVEAFEKTEADANDRVAHGEAKYAQTAHAASEERKKLRASLGNVRIRVARPANVAVTVDGRPVALDTNGQAVVLHAPGSASVVVHETSGAEQRQAVTVLAGSTVEMEFAGDAPAPSGAAPPPLFVPPPPPETASSSGARSSPRSWAIPAAIGSGVLTLAATAVFVGFGSSSHSTYQRLLAECGPSNCGPAERSQADSAQRDQTIANVGLAVAGVAAVATVAFVVVALTSPSR